MTNEIYSKKVILVTASSARTGNAVARYFIKHQARVILNYRKNKKGVQQILSDFPGTDTIIVQGDLTLEKDVKRLTAEIKDQVGFLDGLVHVVGDYFPKPVMETSFSDWKHIISNNLDSAFLLCKNCYDLLKGSKSPRVVTFAYSMADRVVASKNMPYHIAKMGVICLSKTLAREWGADRISVNVISPGTLFNSIIKASENPEDFIPQGRFGEYTDLWPVLDLIFREDSTYITGNNFVISGGYNL